MKRGENQHNKIFSQREMIWEQPWGNLGEVIVPELFMSMLKLLKNASGIKVQKQIDRIG